MSKIKIEEVAAVVADQSWQLISTEYTNLDTIMEFQCPEGHHVFAPWKKMRSKLVCPTCSQNILNDQPDEIIPKPIGVRRVLALDQATHITGYAIFDNTKLIKFGKFETNEIDEIKRDTKIKQWLLSMISNWRPDFIGLEGIQLQDESAGEKMGVTVFQALARLQGILMQSCYESKVEYDVCPTNTWRHFCGVKGRARADRKRSMQLLVKEWYDVSVSDDESDAIGIGRYYVKHLAGMQIQNWET